VSHDVNEELAIQYAMARRQHPLADIEEIADIVLSRLSDEEQLVLAGDALLWIEGCSGRRELARHVVVSYVRDIEAGRDVDTS
jgi:hypothetical protein